MYGSECVWIIAVNLCINILLRKKQGSHGVAFKFFVGANGTFFVFFRTAGRMEKDLMRGPSHILLVRYHHSSLLCRNVQWRDKELASLPRFIIRRQCG